MSFYLRKSVSFGPIRFNLSGSGIGVSAGVKGFRVGTGPRGNYVHLGRGGIYYRHTFASSTPPPAKTGMQEIESGAASAIVDTSSEELLAELRTKRRKLTMQPFAVPAMVLLQVLGFSTGSATGVLLCAAAGLTLILLARRRDRIVRTAVILYELEPPVEEAFRVFNEWARTLVAACRTWHVAASAGVTDRKYHAGASGLVQRNVMIVRMSPPPLVKTNVPVLSIGAGRQTLYFLPDRLLIYDGAGIGAVSYRTLDIVASRQRFIEHTRVPLDAAVVDYTWQYTNKSGGPDRRFRNNRQIPICLYDELSLRTPSGLNETFQISRAGAGEGFAAAVRYLAGVTA